MEKASGVYLTITDNSIQTGGTAELKVIVPMITTRGNIGFNKVTANDFKNIVGYDLSYNSNYAGLAKILEKVSYAYVWRLNQNSKLANAYFQTATSDKAYNDDAETIEDVTKIEPANLLAIGNRSTGNWQTSAVKFAPTPIVTIQANKNPTATESQVIELESVSSTEKTKVGVTEVNGGLVFYNSSNNVVVGVIKANVLGNLKVYKVVDGEIVDDVVDISDPDNPTITTDNSIGTATFTDEKLTITLTKSMSKDSFWNMHIIPSAIEDWTLSLASYDGRTYSIQNTYDFSFNVDSEIYIDKVDFGDLFVQVTGTLPSTMTSIREYFTLEGGSNGDNSITAIDIDTSVLDNCKCNVLAMNGITDYKIVNRLASKALDNKIHIFADAPAYKSYVDVEQWAKKITNSQYVAIGARPDTTEDSDGKTIYIYPSVSYVEILANMLNNYGSLNFPPAGPTYGVISVSDLINSDYEMYANELKTNRINWQRTNNVGTMMWEQRTTYALNSDLSYIAPVFIVDALADEIVTFEQNFNFRYMTPTDILNQQSGITSILDGYISNNFLYSYDLKMPTYEEAQKAGRTLTVPISVVVMKDSEVIQINLELNNA